MSFLDELPIEKVRGVLGGHPAVAYALVFGSVARREEHSRSDVDIAVGGEVPPMELLELEHRLEELLGRTVQVLGVGGAPPALRYRVFKDGRILMERDHEARVQDQARAVSDYMDYRRFEESCVHGVLSKRTGASGDGG